MRRLYQQILWSETCWGSNQNNLLQDNLNDFNFRTTSSTYVCKGKYLEKK